MTTPRFEVRHINGGICYFSSQDEAIKFWQSLHDAQNWTFIPLRPTIEEKVCSLVDQKIQALKNLSANKDKWNDVILKPTYASPEYLQSLGRISRLNTMGTGVSLHPIQTKKEQALYNKAWKKYLRERAKIEKQFKKKSTA